MNDFDNMGRSIEKRCGQGARILIALSFFAGRIEKWQKKAGILVMPAFITAQPDLEFHLFSLPLENPFENMFSRPLPKFFRFWLFSKKHPLKRWNPMLDE